MIRSSNLDETYREYSLIGRCWFIKPCCWFD